MNTRIASPDKIEAEHLALRASPRPVTRLNRRTLALVAGVLASALFGATLWSLQAQHKPAPSGAELHITDKVPHADNLDKIPRDYTEIPQLGAPLPGDWGVAQAHQQGQIPAAEPVVHRTPTNPSDRHPGGESVAGSPILFRLAANTGEPSADRPSPLPSIPAMPEADRFAALPAAPSDATLTQNQQAHKESFLNEAGDTATRNGGTLQPSPSPYAVMAGTVIAAALVTGINSDLPGQIIATVTEPVYDALTGRLLLIPQGARLLGRYDSQIAFGQRRVLVVWTRLILPDTSSITLDRLPGVDATGAAGLEDGVDWHWDRVFAGAVVSTLLGVGAELAAPDPNGNDGRVIIATRDSVKDSVNQVGQEITKRNLSLQPTLTERAGLPLRVIVNKDLILRPYQPLFYGRASP